MKIILTGLINIFLMLPWDLYGQTYYTWQPGKVVLDNGAIRRTIKFDIKKGTVQTVSMFLAGNNRNFITDDGSPEFRLAVDDKLCSGQNRWEYLRHTAAKDDHGGSGVTLTFRGTSDLNTSNLIFRLSPVHTWWIPSEQVVMPLTIPTIRTIMNRI
jgi:hypothetical protein